MTELNLLMAAKLKGRISAELAAGYAGVSVAEAASSLQDLVTNGLVTGDQQFRISPAGRERVDELLAAERATVDTARLREAYHDFDGYNTTFKAILKAWQMTDATTLNDHTDAAYDADVIARLVALHHDFAPLVQRMADAAARLAPFPDRLRRAIEAVQAGDHTYIARPIMDSYHTVWFELHEELIGLLGLSRAEEAAAGRAV